MLASAPGENRSSVPKEVQEAPAGVDLNPSPAGATSNIGEIFHFARKVMAQGIPMDELVDRGFDVGEFLSDLEESPLFLRVPA